MENLEEKYDCIKEHYEITDPKKDMLNSIESALCMANGYDLRGIDINNTKVVIVKNTGFKFGISYKNIREMIDQLGNAPLKFSNCTITKGLITFELAREN